MIHIEFYTNNKLNSGENSSLGIADTIIICVYSENIFLKRFSILSSLTTNTKPS